MEGIFVSLFVNPKILMNYKKQMKKKYKIRTGELVKISKGVFSSIQLIYSGMPTTTTFAISPIISQAFLGEGFKFSPLVYYSVESEEIIVLESQFKVVEVSPTYIILKPTK